MKHLELVLKRLHEKKLAINLEKYAFMKIHLTFLVFVISKGTLKMDPKKVEAILNFPAPKAPQEVRSFRGLVTFYRKFVQNFSHICTPLLDIIKGGKKTKLQWTTQEDDTFQYLKRSVAQYPILALPTFNKLFIVETNASNLAIGVVFSQDGRTIAFFSQKLINTKKK